MNTAYGNLEGTRTIEVNNVRFEVSAVELIRMVYEAAEPSAWIGEPANFQKDATPNAVIGSVVTCCYALGIYGSQQIEAAATEDAVVRYLCAKSRPDWEPIRHFRRRNMPQLKFAIARLLTIATQGKLGERGADPRFFFNADQCLGRAIQADTYALDI